MTAPSTDQVTYECQPDLNGCGHRWEQAEEPDTFTTCPQCGESAGALV